MSFAAPLIREGLRQAFRYTVKAINLQDDALRAVLQTSPSRNILGRGGIRGIRHGLAGGTIGSPFIEQYKGIANVIQEKQNGRKASSCRLIALTVYLKACLRPSRMSGAAKLNPVLYPLQDSVGCPLQSICQLAFASCHPLLKS